MSRGARCVQCRQRPADPAWRPFCSERCRLLDLQGWLDGRYRVPGGPAADSDDPDPAGGGADAPSGPFSLPAADAGNDRQA